MLQITAEQMAAFFKADFENRALPELCAHLRREHGAALSALDDATLRARVRASVAVADSFGLTTRNDVYGFVTLDLTVAEGFHRDPEVRALLEASRSLKTERMQDLMLRLPTEAWVRLCSIDLAPHLDAAAQLEREAASGRWEPEP